MPLGHHAPGGAEPDDGGGDYGSPLLGNRDEDGVSRRNRTIVLMIASMSIATVLGAGYGAMLIMVGIPEPSVREPGLHEINALWMPLYVAVGFAFGHAVETWTVFRTLRWVGGTEPPTEEEARATLALPSGMYRFHLVNWVVAAVVFGVVYGNYDVALVPKVSLVVLGAGLVTSGITMLLAEFCLRPVTAIVLQTYRPTPRHQSLQGRSLGLWMLGSGLPMLGVVLVGVFALFEPAATTGGVAIGAAALAGGGIVSGSVLNLLGVSRVSGPVRSVTAAMRRVSEGRYDTEVVVYDGTTLGDLQSGFNQMAAGLRERERVRDLYARQVGEQVARATIESEPELGGVEQRVAVIFIDLVGSTALAAERPATEVVQILNRFCGVVVAEVNSRGGLVNKFEGDAVLAIFGTPTQLTDPAGAALAAARAMMQRLAREVPEVRAGCGVTYGTVVAGYVGAADRFEYTVIGDPVNEASRLSTQAKADPTVPWASAPAIFAAVPAERRNWRVGPTEVLRGRNEPTRMYLAVR
ncbi:adenylate/guanylate cyclase domain-containing protein [Tsukamurella sp. 1534]|uniref:adenylate/guanylate cyclase domain-containing protein n=1 Tax=Tsukamurella sp. 1534 TaxID=1151061 RepID=UPI000304F4B1|nr:adenylate/guanylate cyclase domain-containing protein [Tsukamurella sp. 1534]